VSRHLDPPGIPTPLADVRSLVLFAQAVKTNIEAIRPFVQTTSDAVTEGMATTQSDLADEAAARSGGDAALQAQINNIGDYVESIVLMADAISLISTIAADITSIALPSGDWDIEGQVWTDVGVSGTTLTLARGWVSPVSATQPSAPASNISMTFSQNNGVNGNIILNTGRARANLSSPGTYYLSCRFTFAVSTLKAYGKIRARRVAA
jgi:hypothetical protein